MALLLFDMGGVMVDGHDVTPDIARELRIPEAVIRRAMSEAGELELYAGAIDEAEFWRRFEGNLNVGVQDDLWSRWFDPERRPEMYDYVTALRASGHRVVCATNTIAPHYAVHQERGDYDVFDAVYASHLIHASKPDPAFWLKILEAEGAQAKDVLFLDDMPVNVGAAAQLGLTAVTWEEFAEVTGEVDKWIGGRA